MKKLKLFLAIAGLFFIASSAQAQHTYKSALGARLGAKNGITYKRFLNDIVALEGLLTADPSTMYATGLYEIHAPALNIKGLKWHYGGGVHLWASKNGDNIDSRYNGSTAFVGVDAIGGLEYTFGVIPINLALNYKPGINIVPGFSFFGSDLNFSVRYVVK